MMNRALNLRANITFPLTNDCQQSYKTLDQLRLQAIQQANFKCRKLRIGTVAFSDKTIVAWKTIEALKLLICKKKGKRVSSRKL